MMKRVMTSSRPSNLLGAMIPNKSSFKFQELTPITGVKPYVIRYWETEFPEISPVAAETGEKIYARKDVEAIFRVKKLLFEDKMTIPEAKARMMDYVTEPSQQVFQDKRSTANDSVIPMIQAALDQIKEIKIKRNW
jgi:DNA-binding transcriptional MerR regulator